MLGIFCEFVTDDRWRRNLVSGVYTKLCLTNLISIATIQYRPWSVINTLTVSWQSLTWSKYSHFLWNLVVHCHAYNSPKQNPGQRRVNPVCVLKLFCLKTIIIITINELTSRSSQSLHIFLIMLLHFRMSPAHAIFLSHLVLYDLFTLTTLGGNL